MFFVAQNGGFLQLAFRPSENAPPKGWVLRFQREVPDEKAPTAGLDSLPKGRPNWAKDG